MPFKQQEDTLREAELARKLLQENLCPLLLSAPRLNWNQIGPRAIRYLYYETRHFPWFNHLAFMVAVLSSHTKLGQRTIEKRLYMLQARWRVLFPRYQITDVEDWKPSEHFSRYVSDTELTDTPHLKQHFLSYYYSSSQQIAIYIRTLPEAEREKYQQWILPPLLSDQYHTLSRGGAIQAEQQQRRKEETDAISSHFARLRGEAHLRWNQLRRLHDKFHEAVALVRGGHEELPLIFLYEEPRLDRRLHFRLWDRTSFFEHHIDQYSYLAKREHARKIRGFAPEKNHFFLEFLHAEDMKDGSHDPDIPLWFGDLLKYDLLANGPGSGSAEEIQSKQQYLRNWGYGEDDENKPTYPFRTNIAGLLTWQQSLERALQEARKRTGGVVFHVDSLYAAATFGLAALDFFTTTGARNGEIVQLSLDQDCLYTLEVEGIQRFLARLVPKNSDKPADYIVGTETRKNLERVGDLLQEHYGLREGEPIPHVVFNPRNEYAHRFKEARPYLFQYNRKHFSEHAINACLRFLMHGLVFQAADGKNVTLKAHTLRHLFATHLHHVEAVPLDVIAVMLHQKNVQVTAYYAAPPWQHVLATANTLLDKFATHLGSIEEAFVRAPAELQRQLEEAKVKVGSLNNVPGGQCTCYAICPIAFACTGCVYNVPDPDREEEIIEQEQWAFIRLDQVKKRGQGPEIVKMEALIQRCRVTRQEMQLMRTYRKDEAYEPPFTIERDEQRTETNEAVAPQALRGETSADDHTRQGRRRSARQRTANGHD
jgi:hypothetical protein